MSTKYVPVAKEDTYKLIEAAQKGDPQARELVVNQNIGLVKNLAMKYASNYYEPEDLIQVGFVGLVKAIDRFDCRFDVMFSTYAVPMILGEIKRFIRDDGKIKVLNSGHIKTLDGPYKESTGKAKVKKNGKPGQLQVSFFGPFYSDYYILDLAPDYSYSVVGSSSPKYLWILSRTPQLASEQRSKILKNLQQRGYDTSKLIWVEQK